MAERNQLRRALSRGDSGYTGGLQWVSLGIMAEGLERLSAHLDLSLGYRLPHRFGLCGNVNHPGAAARIVMAEFSRHGRCSVLFSRQLDFSSTSTHSPASIEVRSGCCTRKQFAAARLTRSPEPCDETQSTTESPSILRTRAGINTVRLCLPGRALARRARRNTGSSNDAPASTPSAGRTKSSNVTKVETGLPGRPKKNFSCARPKTTGLPGRMAAPRK